MKQLMHRRIILPPQELYVPFPGVLPILRPIAFLTLSGPSTNIMRDLVRHNATDMSTYAERIMYRLRVAANDDYGIPLTLNYRHTYLNDELDALTEVGIGADWDVYQNGAYVDFKVFYPYKGRDRTRGNAAGYPEMIWSLDRATVVEPSFNQDRLDEATVVYVAGEGVGANRQIEERHNIVGREDDSPWNRIEAFIDGSRETSTAALYAQGDAHLVEHGMKQEYALASAPKEVQSYGRKWNLGDLCTGEYAGHSFPCRVVSVREVLQRDGVSVPVIIPTLFVYPRLEDY
jgi:hypothetical protein